MKAKIPNINEYIFNPQTDEEKKELEKQIGRPSLLNQHNYNL
jgi:hypothetical protein